jgi:hypothetical protein
MYAVRASPLASAIRFHPDFLGPSSPLKVVVPDECAASPTKFVGGAAALPRSGIPPSASFLSMPASPLRFSPSPVASPNVAKHSSPDRWLNHVLCRFVCDCIIFLQACISLQPLAVCPYIFEDHNISNYFQDLSSAPRLSPSHSRTSSSLRDSWFDVEWLPPPGLESLAPMTSLTDSSNFHAPSPKDHPTTATSSGSVPLKDPGSPSQMKQSALTKDYNLRMIKTPPPPSRAALAAAKRFFLSRHGKDCM